MLFENHPDNQINSNFMKPVFKKINPINSGKPEPTIVIGLFSLFITIAYNGHLWTLLNQRFSDASLNGFKLLLLWFSLIFIFNFMILSFVSAHKLLKPALIIILCISSLTAYFIDTYHVAIDISMIQNIAETDFHETHDLITLKLLAYFLLLGVLPALLLAKLNIKYVLSVKSILHYFTRLLGSLLALGLLLSIFYKDISIMARENRDLRYYINSASLVFSALKFSVAALQSAKESGPIKPLGLDAQRTIIIHDNNTRKKIFVLIIGETARAANIGLGGYHRDTSPYTSQQDIIYFNHVNSCGTATAISLPCMFSHLTQAKYDETQAAHQENLLDIAQHAGLDVQWFDNNSGCKGVCDRVSYHIASLASPESLYCNDDDCYDEILLENLQTTLNKVKRDSLIILHLQGSHGPAYSKRYPESFSVFTPACHELQISTCEQQHIINAYDNTLIYTDYVLSKLINALKNKSEHLDTAMLYISDHGESLGEYGLYLHGLPYTIAPDEQKQVPMMLWLSPAYQQAFGLDYQCIKKLRENDYSHDYLFHSMLSILNIKTAAYLPEYDIFRSCK